MDATDHHHTDVDAGISLDALKARHAADPRGLTWEEWHAEYEGL